MLRATIALIWAVVIGVPMGVAAGLLGFSLPEALVIGVLGGLGAAVFILFFAAPISPTDRSRGRSG